MNPPTSKHRRKAMTLIPAITAVGLTMVAGLGLLYHRQIDSIEFQGRAQLKLDYAQKEEALIRALLHIVPNKAIGAMREGSASNPLDYNWESIFTEAMELASAEVSIDSATLAILGSGGEIVGNPGDTTFDSVQDFATPIVGTSGFVNPGLSNETNLLAHGRFGHLLPTPLETNYSVFQKDEIYPVISEEKKYGSDWTQGLLLSPNDYPQFNLLPYPNIRFGYARPGEPFVAKRNWWAFSLRLAAKDAEKSQIPVIEKHFVLSIYEVPSQLPISASSFMSLGQHSDGSEWQNATVTGGIYAGKLETEGNLEIQDGIFSARDSMQFSPTTTVGGEALGNNFDELGVRETREAQTGDSFHTASVSGNVGRAVFIPLNRGSDYLELHDDGDPNGRLSPTGWNEYSTGAIQAKMRVEILEASDIPLAIRFHYQKSNGGLSFVDFERGENWPTVAQPEGLILPFQTDRLAVGRNALVINMDRLSTFLETLPDAAGPSTNNSIYIYPNPVLLQEDVELQQKLAVSLREGEDLSDFSTGFSLVTNLRLYIASSLNTVPTTPPSGSGIAQNSTYFPPLSLYAPEKRFGIYSTFDNPVDITGQLSSLKVDDNDAFLPLDLKTGRDENVSGNMVSAELKSLRSPAELPPIVMMNWLVVIEEIFDS